MTLHLGKILFAVLLCAPFAGMAQEDAQKPNETTETDTVETLLVVPSPTLDPVAPYEEGWDVGAWHLHSGFNAQFSMNVTAGFGSHAPRGVGFGQSVAFAYVYPVNDKLMVAAGVHANHMNWGGYNDTQVGIRGLVLYSPNERVNLWAYAEKNFLKSHTGGYYGYPWYYGTPSERFAAGGNFKVGRSGSVGFSIDYARYDNDRHDFFRPGGSALRTYRGLDW